MNGQPTNDHIVIWNRGARWRGIYCIVTGLIGTGLMVYMVAAGLLLPIAAVPMGLFLLVFGPLVGYLVFIHPHVMCDPGSITVQHSQRSEFISWHDLRGARSVPQGGRQALGIARADGTTVAFAGINSSATSRPKLPEEIAQVDAMAEHDSGSPGPYETGP